MLTVIYAECHLCWVSFMLSVIYAECHLCWVSFMLGVIYAECRLCWVPLCWMSLSWMSWGPFVPSVTTKKRFITLITAEVVLQGLPLCRQVVLHRVHLQQPQVALQRLRQTAQASGVNDIQLFLFRHWRTIQISLSVCTWQSFVVWPNICRPYQRARLDG
jgi:hypothetical protein